MTKYKNGIYDITNDEYHSSEGVSRSMLMDMMQSPYHYWYNHISGLAIHDKPTPAMILGRVVHTLTLEPHKFENEFCVKPKIEKLPEKKLLKDVGRIEFEQNKAEIEHQQNKNSQILELFEINSKGKTIITHDDYEQAKLMALAVTEDKFTNQLLEDSLIEQSIYFNHEPTGLQCKIRPDAWSGKLICDLKTTKNASYIAFQRDALNKGYFLQAGMMFYAMKAIEKPIKSFAFVCVESKAPYATAIYPIKEDDIDSCIEMYNNLMKKLKHCIDSNKWPAYSMQDLALPKWFSTMVDLDEEI